MANWLGGAVIAFALSSADPQAAEPFDLSAEQVRQYAALCEDFAQTGSPVPGLTCLIGDFSQSSADILEAIEQPWRIMVANTPGGDLQAGLRIGRMLHERLAALIVDTQCLSSCANYLVPGSRYLYVREASVIALHGSAAKDHMTFAAMRAAALGYTREDFAANPALALEIFDQFEGFRRDFVIPEADYFAEIYTSEGYLNRYWEVERTLKFRPERNCRPSAGLFLIPGPVYFEAFSIDVIDMWWPEDRAELLEPIEAYLDTYSVIADFDEHPIWLSQSGLVDPSACEP
jgi:hypothetical protein